MLKPTMRLKQRYVLFKVMPSEAAASLEADSAHRLIFSSMKSLYGDAGIYPMGYRFIHYDKKTGYGVVRFSRKYLMKGIAAIALITELGTDGKRENKKVRFMCMSSSGTLHKINEKFGRFGVKIPKQPKLPTPAQRPK